MWKWLIPILKTALANFTVESIADWGTCFATASVSTTVFIYQALTNLSCDLDLGKPAV